MRVRLAAAGLALFVLGACSAPAAPETPMPTSPPTLARTEPPPTELPPAEAADLESLPIIPDISPAARAILQQGIEQGRDPHIFTRIGDCMSSSPNYLTPIGVGEYDLGDYPDLQAVIDHYAGTPVREYEGQTLDPFASFSIAATEGFNSASVMEPLWSNPAFCEPRESPLACEYRVSNASVALIMFGTNDVHAFDAAKFEGYLRTVIAATLDAGVLPVLITFPPQPGLEDESRALNDAVKALAAEYHLPLVNLWRALQDNPDYGINPDQTNHLSVPADGCMACFDVEHLSAGITEQNLVVLQTLDKVRAALSQ